MSAIDAAYHWLILTIPAIAPLIADLDLTNWRPTMQGIIVEDTGSVQISGCHVIPGPWWIRALSRLRIIKRRQAGIQIRSDAPIIIRNCRIAAR
jgi:hypothetical protein